MTDPGRVVIVGAGPTGLGAAYRLTELGVRDFVVLDRASGPGGLAASHVDDQGFTWDIGGHVQFSHYQYYDDALERAVTCGWLEHARDASVWIKQRWVPYPFQNNIHRLPESECARALADLEAIARAPARPRPENFAQWIAQSFGPTIAELFLFPYNRKIWGYPLDTMGVDWMGERVAVVDVERVRRNVTEQRDDVGWGPNNTFRFPLRGGTGAIWAHVAALLPPGTLRYNTEVTAVDGAGRHIGLNDGTTLAFGHLINTMPLDMLCAISRNVGDDVKAAAAALRHSAVHIFGIGLRGGRPDAMRRKCWMYFPESNSPYYRVTVFTNYSPHNAPDGADMWSLMAEVCESPAKPVDRGTLKEWTLNALRQDGLIGQDSEVVSFWHHREEHGYPTPFLGRDVALQAILPQLEIHHIYSRGRFGAWKYEVSNQDHSFMQGVEVVDRIMGGGDEPTLNRPSDVNSGRYRTTPAQGRRR